MHEKKYSTVGGVYAVMLNGDYLRKPRGYIKVWSTVQGAEKAAKTAGGKAVSLSLTKVDYYEPKLTKSEDVLETLNHLKQYYDREIPRTSIFDISLDHQTNVLRHRPVGSGVVTKQDVQKGDSDVVVDMRIKFYADQATINELL